MALRIFPRTAGAWTRLCLSVALLLIVGRTFHADAVVGSWFYPKQEGDILLQSLPHGELVDAWSHCGVLVQRDGRWVVVEALGEVRETPLKDWIVRSRGGHFAAYRVKGLSDGDRDHLKASLAKYRGRPYDFGYAPGDEAIYCSELAFKAYDAALQIKLGEWQKLGELDWKPWEEFIRRMEGTKLPLDRPMITPDALTHAERIERVYP